LETGILSDPFIENAMTAFFSSVGIPVPSLPTFSGNFDTGLNAAKIPETNFRLTAIMDYKLSDHWHLHPAVSYNNFNSSDGVLAQMVNYSGGFTTAPDGTLLYAAQLFPWGWIQNSREAYVDVLGSYDLGQIGAKFNVLAGADINQEHYDDDEEDTQTATVSQPVYAWNPNIAVGPYAASPWENSFVTDGTNFSVYAQGQLKWWHDRVQLTAAGRTIYQNMSSYVKVPGGVPAVQLTKTHTPIFPTVTLLVKPVQWLSVYANASEYQDPAVVEPKYYMLPPGDPRSSETITSQPTTKLVEFGVKASLLDGRITLSLDEFRVESIGTVTEVIAAEANPTPPPATITYGYAFLTSRVAQGFEVEAFGALLNNHLTYMLGGSFGNRSSDTGVFSGTQILTNPNANMPNTVDGYLSYNFGRDKYDGLGVTVGWKTTFSGWNVVPFGVYPSVAAYPHDLNSVNLGLSYGFLRKYEVFVKGTDILSTQAQPSVWELLNPGRQIIGGVSARF
jgi:hypothetical protein